MNIRVRSSIGGPGGAGVGYPPVGFNVKRDVFARFRCRSCNGGDSGIMLLFGGTALELGVFSKSPLSQLWILSNEGEDFNRFRR